ncbi:Sigma-70 region 3 [Actinoplanes derwentensis]|uniref:Sigma-70 region 3 n=1 Tax=Actinoplanes derwentensis TaxID=113562 RepID=A0A1H1SZM7_9ACTN|nr:hypothetical protein Ade03nite_89960 [Actinoplanes derwentensis]SDS52849.1 Sigma-70 region 3 [Actinoplanes derwentensis]
MIEVSSKERTSRYCQPHRSRSRLRLPWPRREALTSPGRGTGLAHGIRQWSASPSSSRLAITGANNTLSHTLGRAPTVTDIATYLEISEDEVIEGLEGARAYNSTSLSTPISDGGTELGETLGGEDTGFAEAETRVGHAPKGAPRSEAQSTEAVPVGDRPVGEGLEIRAEAA